jgi:hypothetical protein
MQDPAMSEGRSERRWRVALTGDSPDLRDVATLFAASDPTIIEESGAFYLMSSDFEAYDDPQEVLQSAASALPRLNGVARARLSEFEGITLRAVVVERIDEKTSHVTQLFGTRARVVVQEEGAFSNGTTVGNTQQEAVAQLARAASDEHLARALAIYGVMGDTWVGLYMVLDVLSDDLGSVEAVKKSGFAPRAKITLLRRTANSYAGVGFGARHATEKFEAPETPMSLGEGKRVVGKLLDGWMRSKGI